MTQGMLITVKHSEVPKYLHSSELYGTFSDEADDEISVPKDCIKPNPSVRTVDELQHLLATLRFWILRAFPRDLIHFLVSRTNSDVVLDVLSNFRDAFPDVWQLLSSLKMSQCKQACRQSAEFGRIDFLQYFIQLKKPLSMSVLVAAADNGHVDCLRHVHSALVAEKHLNWKDIDISSVIRRGQSTCLFYMIEQGVHISERGCILAAQTSHFTCLELLLSASSVRTEAVCTSAVKNGGARTLQCAVEKGCTVGERTWTAAIALSDTSCFQYLLDSFPNTSAKRGSLECLEFLHELNFACWVPSTVAAAAGAGQLGLVRVLHERGCPWNHSTTCVALRRDKDRCLEYLLMQRGLPDTPEFRAIEPRGLACRLTIVKFQLGQLGLFAAND